MVTPYREFLDVAGYSLNSFFPSASICSIVSDEEPGKIKPFRKFNPSPKIHPPIEDPTHVTIGAIGSTLGIAGVN